MSDLISPEVIWKPQPGPQTLLLSCPVSDVFFGGARGGGKTDALIGAWLAHSGRHGSHARGILFRRSMSELDEVQTRLRELFPRIGATYKASPKTWTMGNGAVLRLRYLEADEDASRYQGHQLTFLAFDEAGNWPTSRGIDMLRACLRSPHGVPTQLILTGNPGGKGHEWIRERYIDSARPGVPFQGPDGVLRVFIPSRLQDNRVLMEKDPGYIDRLKASGPAWLVRAWLEGDWEAMEQGNLFRREDWRFYREPPKFSQVLQSLDSAFKAGAENDYSVLSTWGVAQDGFYLLHVWRGKVEFPVLKRQVVALAEIWNPNILLVEDKASGQSLIQELRSETRLPIRAVQVDRDKLARAYAVTPLVEAGRVFLPEEASWVTAFIEELATFPKGGHDDQVDSFTQALNHLRTLHQSSGMLFMGPRRSVTDQLGSFANMGGGPSSIGSYRIGFYGTGGN